jgi:hypothetical protein
MTVWIYADTSKQVGDPDHLKVSASQVAAPAASNRIAVEAQVEQGRVIGRFQNA